MCLIVARFPELKAYGAARETLSARGVERDRHVLSFTRTRLASGVFLVSTCGAGKSFAAFGQVGEEVESSQERNQN